MNQLFHLHKPTEERLTVIARDKGKVEVRSPPPPPKKKFKESSLSKLDCPRSSTSARATAAFEDVLRMYSLAHMRTLHVSCKLLKQGTVGVGRDGLLTM